MAEPIDLTKNELEALSEALAAYEELLSALSKIEAWPAGGVLHIETEIVPGYLGWIGYGDHGSLSFHPCSERPEGDLSA